MALEQDIIMMVATNEKPRIRIANTDTTYVEYDEEITVWKGMEAVTTSSAPQWFKYFACGYRGIIERWAAESDKGMLVLVEGTVPPSSGLSSSSAMVVSAALVTLKLHNLNPSKKEIATVCGECEKYVGCQGGGMDQAISLLAEPSTCKFIEFNPLRTTDVQLTSDAGFVVAHCGVSMNKAATFCFNTRVVECTLAKCIIAKLSGLDNWKELKNLYEVQSTLNLTEPKEMLSLVEKYLNKGEYTIEEIENIMECRMADVLLKPALLDAAKQTPTLKLKNRALHVFSEAQRVLDFKALCSASSSHLSDLGELMTDSHASCRDLYECSVKELDELVDTSLKMGAYGARLTGAGWGGCAVILIDKDKSQTLMDCLIKEKYNPCFCTTPSGGASVQGF